MTGPAPVQVVWERYADPTRWADWAPHVRGVEVDVHGEDVRLQPGLSGRVRGPMGLRVPFVVTAVDEERRTWSWTVRAPLVTVHLDHTLAEVSDGTVAGLVLRGPWPVIRAYRPVARWALRRLVARP